MMNAFPVLSEILARWPQIPIPSWPFEAACQERLRKVLYHLAQGFKRAVGPGDLAGLIRHLLRHEGLLNNSDPVLRVPCGDAWPQEEHWACAGMSIISRDSKSFLLKVQPWTPDWLPGSNREPPLEAAFGEELRRRQTPVPIDPCLQEKLGGLFNTYISPGQCAAVRSVFFSNPGAVIIVNLPTGAGKSLVAWAPSFVIDQGGCITLAVVPTVALALDQERQVQRIMEAKSGRIPGPLAWHGGLSQEDRQTIRQNISSGTQPIVFASPESVVGGLARPLYEAAERGFLRYFIIDEAHMVGQWGNEFRPEFQAMAGLRNDLKRHCPPGQEFRTLLMTATLTQENYDTLETLFGSESGIQVVSAAHLRPEPGYWVYRAADEQERHARVLEVVRCTPRPFILYVTRQEDVGQWLGYLREYGFYRLRGMHGGTPSDERRLLIDRWIAGEIDGVVATSAFGLGMDKADVRAVIHACVPETVDRFYQEVGRGGRDGKACVSFLIYTENDLHIAKSLNRERIITIENGLKRWQAMAQGNVEEICPQSNIIRVDLTSKPDHIIMDSKRNIGWNLRTLTLMARTGLLAIESEPPPRLDQGNDETDNDYQKRLETALENYYRTRPVRLTSQGHQDPQVWKKVVEPERRRIHKANSTQIRLMSDIRNARKEFSKILAEIYHIQTESGEIIPERVCGGCPVCRQGDNRISYEPAPEAINIRQVNDRFFANLLKIVGDSRGGFSAVAYKRPSSDSIGNWKRKILAFLKSAVQKGVGEIASSSQWLNERDYRDLYRFSPYRFVLHTDITEKENPLFARLPIPRISLLDPVDPPTPIPEHLFLLDRPLHLVVAPEDIPDNHHQYRKFFDVTTYYWFEDLHARLER